MVTADLLHRSIQHTHDELAAGLAEASTRMSTRSEPRKALEAIDTFLAIASKHLSAVDAALLPIAQKRLTDGAEVVHDYLQSARHLEVMLAHVKARAYGSVFEAGHHWNEVWDDVAEALAAHRRCETDLADQLTEVMDAEEFYELTGKLHQAESDAPSRPHPYTPHTGLPGLVARKVMHVVDAFWDMAEGRMTPTPVRPKRKKPGLVAQYFLADPRFDENEAPPRS